MVEATAWTIEWTEYQRLRLKLAGGMTAAMLANADMSWTDPAPQVTVALEMTDELLRQSGARPGHLVEDHEADQEAAT